MRWLWLVVMVSSACGDDATDPHGLPDVTDAAPDVGAATDSAPAPEVGPMVATRMEVTPATVVAGEVALLTCHGIDDAGNPTGDAAYTAVTPGERVSIVEKRELTATIAGRYALVCETPELPAEAKGQAELTVVAGPEVRRALGFLPERPAHGLGQTVIVVGAGFDAFDNRRDETYPVSDVRVSPDGHHRLFGEGQVFSADDEQFAELLKNMMLPQLFQGLDDLLTFRLPSLDLGELTSVLPAGTILDIDVSAIGRDNAYLVVRGALK